MKQFLSWWYSICLLVLICNVESALTCSTNPVWLCFWQNLILCKSFWERLESLLLVSFLSRWSLNRLRLRNCSSLFICWLFYFIDAFKLIATVAPRLAMSFSRRVLYLFFLYLMLRISELSGGDYSNTSECAEYWAYWERAGYPGLPVSGISKSRSYTPYLLDTVHLYFVICDYLVSTNQTITAQNIWNVLKAGHPPFQGCTGEVAISPVTGSRNVSVQPPIYDLVSLTVDDWEVRSQSLVFSFNVFVISVFEPLGHSVSTQMVRTLILNLGVFHLLSWYLFHTYPGCSATFVFFLIQSLKLRRGPNCVGKRKNTIECFYFATTISKALWNNICKLNLSCEDCSVCCLSKF